jgi:hypothetical protein
VTFNHLPFGRTLVAEQRRSDTHAQANRYRLARVAQGSTNLCQQWLKLPAVLGIVGAQMLLFVAGSAVVAESLHAGGPSHGDEHTHGAPPVLDGHLFDPF